MFMHAGKFKETRRNTFPRPFTTISTPLCIKFGRNPHAEGTEIFNVYFKKDLYIIMTQGPTEAMIQYVQQHIPPGAALQQSSAVPEVTQQL